jgi:hypothetical protein
VTALVPVLGGAGLGQGRAGVAHGASVAVGQGARRSIAHRSRGGGVGQVWRAEDRTSGRRLFCRWRTQAGGRAHRGGGVAAEGERQRQQKEDDAGGTASWWRVDSAGGRSVRAQQGPAAAQEM